MRRHPGWGWRGQCVLVMGGLAASVAVPQTASAIVREAVGLQAERVFAAAATQAVRRPVTPVPQSPSAKLPMLGTPAPQLQAQPRADVLGTARQLEQLGRLTEAQRAYQAVLMRYPQHIDCLHRLGVVCTRLNEFGSAQAHFDRALLISPNQPQVLIDAGYSRYLAGDYRQAEKYLRKAVELSPEDARANNNLAVVLGVTGRFDESLTLFQRANSPSKAWTNLAYVYQLRKEPEQALICYQRAHAIDSNILIPEELLVQTAPTERLITDADLPPAPRTPAAGPPKLPAAPIAVAATAKPPTIQPTPSAQRPAPSWTAESRPSAEPQPQIVVPAIGKVESAGPFEPPVIAETETSPAADDPFEAPLVSAPRTASAGPATHAPVLDSEPALTGDISVAGQPVRFETPTGFTADESLDAQEMAWLASERAKLVKRAHFEGLKGFCLVTLCEERRLEEAHAEFNAEFHGQQYTFCSAEAAERFLADPELYVPAAGGLDIVAVRKGGHIAGGSLDFAVWYRNRLYLFTTQQHKDEFSADPHKFIKE